MFSAGLATPTAQAQTLRERLMERAQARQAASPSDAPPASWSEESFEHDGVRRTYLVHVPANLADAPGSIPVVLALHGGGGNAAFMAQDAHFGLLSKAAAAGFIVVFPNGFSQWPGGKFAAWNAGNCCGDARDRAVDDVGFMKALVKRLQTAHHIDPKRVYAVGLSNGGMMAHRLACEAADVFAAAASVAGTDNTATCVPSRPISVLSIHAKDDDHVLFEGGAGPASFRDASKVTSFTSVPLTIARWTARNHCNAKTSRPLEVAGAYCETHPACDGDAEVQWCVTETGGHSWPGAQAVAGGKASPSQALSANDVVWRFFKSHRLP